MDTPKIRIDLHRSQYEAHISQARFRVLACGRRWGKTCLGVNECMDVALSGGRAWWVAPNYKMSRVGWRPLSRFGALIGAEVRKGDMQVITPNGGEISVRSADDPNSLRGEGLNFAVLDECAFMDEAAWQEGIRPALSDRQGRAVFISTPKGRNWFWKLYQRGLESSGEWKSWRKPTSDNPFISPAEIEQARQDLPELTFEQEYLAVFLEGQGSVFRNPAACMGAPETTPQAHSGHRIVIGADWGKQQDFTTLSAGCATCHAEVDRDRFNKIDYTFQRGRLAAMAAKWRAVAILPERNSIGEPIIEQLLRDGLPIISGPDGQAGFMTTATSKPQLIENLALTLERAEWQFQDDPVWRGELEAFERVVSPVTGRSQYSAPEGMHDDTVIGRALMVWAAGRVSPLPEAQPMQHSKWRDDDIPAEGRWRRY